MYHPADLQMPSFIADAASLCACSSSVIIYKYIPWVIIRLLLPAIALERVWKMLSMSRASHLAPIGHNLENLSQILRHPHRAWYSGLCWLNRGWMIRKAGVQIAGMTFQTRSRHKKAAALPIAKLLLSLYYICMVFSAQNTSRSAVSAFSFTHNYNLALYIL